MPATLQRQPKVGRIQQIANAVRHQSPVRYARLPRRHAALDGVKGQLKAAEQARGAGWGGQNMIYPRRSYELLTRFQTSDVFR
jgi:hypothetical protein